MWIWTSRLLKLPRRNFRETYLPEVSHETQFKKRALTLGLLSLSSCNYNTYMREAVLVMRHEPALLKSMMPIRRLIFCAICRMLHPDLLYQSQGLAEMHWH